MSQPALPAGSAPPLRIYGRRGANSRDKKTNKAPINQKLHSLAAQSAALNARVGLGEPVVQLGVGQLDAKSRSLNTNAKGTDAGKEKANLLLAQKGYDVKSLHKDLADVDLRVTYEPLEPLADTDISAFLEHKHNMIVLTAIEEAKKETRKQFDLTYNKAMNEEWAGRRSEILDEYGQRSGEWVAHQDVQMGGMDGSRRVDASFANRTALLRSGQGIGSFRGSIGVSPIAPGRRGHSTLTSKQLKYVAKLTKLNEARASGRAFPLATAFLDAAENTDDRGTRKQEVANCWRILRDVLGENHVVNSEFQREVLSENVYADDYARADALLERKFINGAKKFLEQQYRDLLQTYVTADAATSTRGGRPGLISTVRTYLDVKFQRGSGKGWPRVLVDRVDDYPVWPMIYLCMRCGDLDAAQQVVQQAAGVLGDFPIFFETHVAAANGSGTLDNNMWVQLSRVFNNEIRNKSQDPYKHAVYVLVGKLNSERPNSEIFCTTQDFMWLKLSMVREEGAASDLNPPYTLTNLQDLLLSYGTAHFNPDGTNPLLFFQVLLLSQQFERAIEYLRSFDDYRVEAVHVACVLSYYGCVRTPQTPQSTNAAAPGGGALVYEGDDGLFYLDFAHLVRQYTRYFVETDFRAALQYLYLIGDVDKRFSAIRDLVLKTREYDVLLGSVGDDGIARPGCIHNFMDANDCVQLAELSAAACESDGKYDDAIKLYHLAENYDKVLALLIRELGSTLTTPSAERDARVSLASAVRGRMETTGAVELVSDPTLIPTFNLLQYLLEFFDRERAGRYADALDLMDSLSLIPSTPADTAARVEEFRYLDDSIRRNFAAILLTTMTIVYKLYQAARSGANIPSGQGGRDAYMEGLRARARAIITFSGMVQFRMPGDTNAKLLRMEVFMN